MYNTCTVRCYIIFLYTQINRKRWINERATGILISQTRRKDNVSTFNWTLTLTTNIAGLMAVVMSQYRLCVKCTVVSVVCISIHLHIKLLFLLIIPLRRQFYALTFATLCQKILLMSQLLSLLLFHILLSDINNLNKKQR